MANIEQLRKDITACTTCLKHLSHGVRPIVRFDASAKIVIIGQAPGRKVHASGIPWDDASGIRLREWMGVSSEVFYDPSSVAIVPMGFCYPGKGKSGDLPPRTECAPLWHDKILDQLQEVRLILLIGQYAQAYYLANRKKTLTDTVKCFQEYGKNQIPLPHPSPRNFIWMKKNPWFVQDVLPYLKKSVTLALK